MHNSQSTQTQAPPRPGSARDVRRRVLNAVLIGLLLLTAAQQVAADELRIGAGLSVEPYIIPEDDAGLEIDIVREALRLAGHNVHFAYEPLQRTKVSFGAGELDGVMTVKAHYPEVAGAHLSADYITYRNFVITLGERGLDVTAVADLGALSVVAFQQASLALGSAFEAMSKRNPRYVELANQRSQVALLLRGRVDAVVADANIFRYLRREVEVELPASRGAEVVFHPVFPPSDYRLAFRDPILRDAFDAGVARLREMGRYDEIVARYVPG